MINVAECSIRVNVLLEYLDLAFATRSWLSNHNSPVDVTEIRGEPRKNSKKADFDIIRKQIFHRITYPKSSKIHLGEIFLWPI